MSDEPAIAPVIQLVPHELSATCVAMLEALLAEARAGVIISLAVATVNVGGEISSAVVKNGNLFMLMGAIASLQADLAAHTQRVKP